MEERVGYKTDSLSEEREYDIDIIKGLLIVLMVYAHTYPVIKPALHIVVIQVFMMTAGYCQKRNITNDSEWRDYVKKRIHGLYVPCVICNVIYTLLGGLFLRLGFYTQDPAFLEISKDWPHQQVLYSINTVSDILKKLCRILLMLDTTQMGTATWFLISLFYISIAYSGVELLAAKLKNRKIVFSAFFVFLFISSWALPAQGQVLSCIKCTLYCGVTFLLGMHIKYIKLKYLYTWPAVMASLVVVIVLTRFYRMDVALGLCGNGSVYITGSIAGWIIMKTVSQRLIRLRRTTQVLTYIGRHTMPILTMHILFFKPVSWLYIRLHHLPQVYLAAFHCIMEASEAWKILYLLSGVCLPLLVSGQFFKFVRNLSIKK